MGQCPYENASFLKVFSSTYGLAYSNYLTISEFRKCIFFWTSACHILPLETERTSGCAFRGLSVFQSAQTPSARQCVYCVSALSDELWV